MIFVAALLEAFAYGLRISLAVLALRALPFVVAFAVARSPSLAAKALAIVAYLATIAASGRFGDIDPPWLVAAHVYFLLVAISTHSLAPLLRSRALAFAVVLTLYLIAPALIVQKAVGTFAALGWELALTAYSYLVLSPRDTAARSLRHTLFFLLVDPTLVYSKRGHAVACAGFSWRGMLRVLGGACAIGLASGPVEPLLTHARELPARYALAEGAAFLLWQYLLHSGRASIQLGLMRQLGYQVAERYDYPVLARSPAQFWRRWNTYVGDWARIHVFRPLAFFAARFTGRAGVLAQSGRALAFIATFAVIGALHDLHDALLARQMHWQAAAWFTAVALVVLAWEASARRVRERVARPACGAGSLALRLTMGSLGRASMATLMLVLATIMKAR